MDGTVAEGGKFRQSDSATELQLHSFLLHRGLLDLILAHILETDKEPSRHDILSCY